MKKFWNRWGGYVLAAGAGLAAGGLVIWYEVVSYATTPGILHLASDGLFVPGIFLCSFGVLTLVAGAGGFDGLSYLLSSLRRLFSPRSSSFEARVQYLDYKLEKQKKRTREEKKPGALLVVGIIFVVISLVLAAL
jgi:hypothetical protein